MFLYSGSVALSEVMCVHEQFYFLVIFVSDIMALSNVLLLSQVAGYVIALILSLCITVPMSIHQDEFLYDAPHILQ